MLCVSCTVDNNSDIKVKRYKQSAGMTDYRNGTHTVYAVEQIALQMCVNAFRVLEIG
jgi:hypothetical protein